MKTYPPNLPTPGRWRRFASAMYDAVLLFGVVFLMGYLFDTLTQSRHALSLRHLRQLWLFVVIGIYFVAAWRLGGQTLAMKSWGIALLNQDGRRLSVAQAVVRYLLVSIIPLGLMSALWAIFPHNVVVMLLCTPIYCASFLWAFFDTDKQFLHDRLLKTRLVIVDKANF